MYEKNMKFTIRDQRNGDWYWISRIIYQEYISKIGVIGLSLYNAYASYSFSKQEVFPSQNTISKKLKISIPTLIKYNKRLVKYKLICIYEQKGKVNIITLLKVKPLNLVKGCTKPPLGVPLNEVKTNNNNTNKLNNILRTKKQCGENDKNKINLFDEKASHKLQKIIQNKIKINKNSQVHKWPDIFRRIRKVDKIDKTRIKNVLNWYSTNIGGTYIPVAHSASAFRDKFTRLESAMKRDKEINYKKEIEISSEAKKISKKLSYLHWPKDSASLLTQTIQITLDNYTKFHKKYNKLDISKYKGCESLYKHLKEVFIKHPEFFTIRWMKDINNKIENWDKWNGDLIKLAFNENSKYFDSAAQIWSIEYCGSYTRWNKLKKALDEN